MKKGLTLVCAAKLHANQLERHLELFEYVPEVQRVVVVRHQPLPHRLSKLENETFGGKSRVAQALRMATRVRRVVQETQADWVLGFNPVPWGSIGGWASMHAGARLCLSLIGMDFLQLKRRWAAPFLAMVRRADAVTVTGEGMRRGMIAAGVAAERLHILPHSVDIERFRPRGLPSRWDIVSVGQLIARKRMDVLLDAVARLRGTRPNVKLGILGKGPLEGALRERVARLHLTENVEFLGYRDDVETILAEARIFCLVSEWEGVPFALMEAMAAAMVPVVTDVGTITDWVKDGQNGRVVPVGDVGALTAALQALLGSDRTEYTRLRQGVIADRDRLSFLAGAKTWQKILDPTGRPRFDARK